MTRKQKQSSDTPDAQLDTGIDPAEGINETGKDAPVYDERGNVRPRGTKGAKPMSYAQRVELAARLGTLPNPDRTTAQARKATAPRRARAAARTAKGK